MNLLLGMMMMNFFQDGMIIGLTSLLNKAGVILKINFPREVVVLSGTFTAVINFAVNMIVFVIFTIFNPIQTSLLGFLLFLLCAISIYVIVIGVSFFMSVLYIRLRDLHQIVELGLQALFWVSPVIYTLEMLPESLRKYLLLNPMTYILVEARKGLIYGNIVELHDFRSILVILIFATVFAYFGYRFFKKNVTKIAEYY
jgi:ABC-type polysaccharide/polyol phosphate export permease